MGLPLHMFVKIGVWVGSTTAQTAVKVRSLTDRTTLRVHTFSEMVSGEVKISSCLETEKCLVSGALRRGIDDSQG